VCVVKTVYHAINNKKNNFRDWFEAMKRAKARAKKRAHNYADRNLASAYEAAGSLVDISRAAMPRQKRTRTPTTRWNFTVNTRVRVRVGMPNVIIVFVHTDVFEQGQGHQIFI
jgi:hypothetical protein